MAQLSDLFAAVHKLDDEELRRVVTEMFRILSDRERDIKTEARRVDGVLTGAER